MVVSKEIELKNISHGSVKVVRIESKVTTCTDTHSVCNERLECN